MVAKRPPRSEKSLYVWGSNVHVALLYGKMTRQVFTIEELRELSSKIPTHDRFRLTNHLTQAVANRHATREGDGWKITPNGVKYLYFMASRHRHYNPMSEEELNEGCQPEIHA